MTTFRSATYQISIVSGSLSANGTAQRGIDGTWIGQALVLDCTGDPRYVCDSTMDVGELRYIRFDFTSAGAGDTVDAEWVDPPKVNATVPIRGTFADQTLTLGADLDVIEYYRGDHAPPTTELARVHVTLATFTATIDDFNRLQGEIRYSMERTRTFPNASLGRVESGSITLRLVDVVPAVK